MPAWRRSTRLRAESALRCCAFRWASKITRTYCGSARGLERAAKAQPHRIRSGACRNCLPGGARSAVSAPALIAPVHASSSAFASDSNRNEWRSKHGRAQHRRDGLAMPRPGMSGAEP